MPWTLKRVPDNPTLRGDPDSAIRNNTASSLLNRTGRLRKVLINTPKDIIAPFMPLAAGTKLGPYEILSPIGGGGMGEVYTARDGRLDRIVAVKIIAPSFSQNADLRRRLDTEARAISKLSHPNICTLHDIGHQNGIDFLV